MAYDLDTRTRARGEADVLLHKLRSPGAPLWTVDGVEAELRVNGKTTKRTTWIHCLQGHVWSWAADTIIW